MSDISFSKLTWENLPARTMALSATNLNRIENGINDSVNGVNSNSHSIAELQTRISQIASGTPEPVNTIAEMTDHSKIYVYTGVCYFGTGDSDTGSYIYHSLDNGLTWTLTYGPNKLRCRQLNFIFTPNKVYWASDSYTAEDHNFFIAERDSNGVIDVDNATGIPLGRVNSQACYGCVYLAEVGLIVMMDRNDVGGVNLTLQAYDMDSNEIVTLGVIPTTAETARSGFRAKFVEWYPTGNSIRVGFNAHSGAVSPDTNVMAILGNQGGTSGDGSTRINNLLMYVYKHGTSYGLRFDTAYV